MLIAGNLAVEAAFLWISLSEAQEVFSAFDENAQLALAADCSRFKPLTLAAANFNEDGMLDLVFGYASPEGAS